MSPSSGIATNSVRNEYDSMKVTISQKKTRTDQYLNFESDHPLDHKLGVIRILHHHACTVIMEKGDRDKAIEHVNKTLRNCSYLDLTKGEALP